MSQQITEVQHNNTQNANQKHSNSTPYTYVRCSFLADNSYVTLTSNGWICCKKI